MCKGVLMHVCIELEGKYINLTAHEKCSLSFITPVRFPNFVIRCFI